MELVLAKIVTAVILLAMTLLAGLIPYWMVLRRSTSVTSSRRRDLAIAFLNCFAGGVFLGTLLVHILEEGLEQFEDYKTAVGLDTEFPIFELFVAGGFFLVAFVELLAHKLLHGQQSDETTAMLTADRDVRNDSVSLPSSQPAGKTYGAIPSGGSTLDPRLGNQQGTENPEDPTDTENLIKSRWKNENSGGDSVESEDGNSNTRSSHSPSGLRALLLVVALSFHTIFDGLAVGLQESVSEVWSVFAAITIHKSVIAFCLGLELFQTNLQRPWRAFLMLFVFGLMSPLGIGIGIELTSGHIDETSKMLASSVLQGVAGGTFMYVTFLEILCVHIGHNSQGGFLHLLFALFGFGLMAASKLADDD